MPFRSDEGPVRLELPRLHATRGHALKGRCVVDANRSSGSSPHSLSLKGLTKRYGQQAAIEDVNIEVARGKFVTLLGPSGSGKTTILMTVAGFVAPTSGQILLDDRDITQLPPEHRNFGMVFQGYALFPHMTVEENVWFPLRVRGVALARARKNGQRPSSTSCSSASLGSVFQRTLRADSSSGWRWHVPSFSSQT